MTYYGYVPIEVAEIPGSPFGTLTPSTIAGYEVMYLVWHEEGAGFIAYLYLSNADAAAPTDAFDSWAFTDDTDEEWTFARAEADDPEGTDMAWGDGNVRAWQWTISLGFPEVTEDSEYTFSFDVSCHPAEHAHSATEVGLDIEVGFEGADELTPLPEFDPSFTASTGIIWVTTAGEVYAEGDNAFALWTDDEFPADQYAQLTLADVGGDALGAIGAAVRFTEAGGYVVVMDGTGEVHLNKYPGPTTLHSFTPGLVSGDVLGLEAIGSTLRVKINEETVYETTDTDHEGGAIGIAGYGDSVLRAPGQPTGNAFKGGNPGKIKLKHAVVPESASHLHSATSPTLSLDYTVIPAVAEHAHEATSPILVVEFITAPANAEHEHRASEPAIEGGEFIVQPDAAQSLHEVTSPALIANFAIVPASAEHSHLATSPALTERQSIVVDSTEHAHSATAPNLVRGYVVIPASAEHTHTATEPNLLALIEVQPDDAQHLHQVTSVGLIFDTDRPDVYYEVLVIEEIKYFEVEEQDEIASVPIESWMAVVAQEQVMHLVERQR